MTIKLRKFRNRVIIVVMILIALFWFSSASSDQDWLWFLPVFNEKATRIHLYRDGEQIVLQSGDPGYDEVNEAINQIVRHVKVKELLRLSPEAQEECYTQFSAVEVFYAEPVIIHTRHGFPKADKYLFPQSGHHDAPPVVFAGTQSQPDYRRGALVLESRDRLDQVVDAIWAAYQ